MRHRERTPILEYQNKFTELFASSPAATCTVTKGPLASRGRKPAGTFMSKSYTETMDDVVTNNFKKLQSKGCIINNPMIKVKTNYDSTPFYYSAYYGMQRLMSCNPPRWVSESDYDWTAQQSMSEFVGFLPVPQNDLDNEIDIAVSKAFAQIGDDKILFLGMVKEFNSTIKGLAYILLKVYRIYKSVRKADLRALRKEISLSELQEIYMNARYNLRPLAYDVKGMIDIFNDKSKPGRQTFRATRVYEFNDSTVSTHNILTTPYFTAKVDVSRTMAVKSKVRAGVLTQVQQTNLIRLAGIDQFFKTAWDLLPFSFIIDWFLNVGDTLLAWVPKGGFEVLTSWVTIDTTVIKTIAVVGSSYIELTPPPNHRLGAPPVINVSGNAMSVVKTFERRPNPSKPMLPSIDINLDLLKILDLAIIMRKFLELKSS